MKESSPESPDEASEPAASAIPAELLKHATGWALRFYAALAANRRDVQQALLSTLRPSLADLQQVFISGYAETALSAYDKLWDRRPAFPIPRPSTVRVELFRGAQMASASSLGPLREVAPAVRPETVWGRVVPPQGPSLDGLVFLPHRVIWLPHPELFLFGRPSVAHTEALAHFCD